MRLREGRRDMRHTERVSEWAGEEREKWSGDEWCEVEGKAGRRGGERKGEKGQGQ